MTRAKLKQLAVVAAIQIGAVGLGYSIGLNRITALRPHWTYLHYLSGIASLMFVVGVIEQQASRNRSQWGKWLSVAAPVYCLGLIACEAWDYWFIMAGSREAVFVAATCLIPLLAMIGPLVRVRAWFTCGGVALFIMSFVGLMTCNANNASSAYGFLVSVRNG
jgi:hypothetical protein